MRDDPTTTVAWIGPANDPLRRADGSLLVGDTNAPTPLIAFSAVPLDVAVESLAKTAGLNLTVDPKLSDSFVDGKFVPVPQVSIRWQNITARQALLALAANYDLAVLQNKESGQWHVERK